MGTDSDLKKKKDKKEKSEIIRFVSNNYQMKEY
jgi:hypothetical protein